MPLGLLRHALATIACTVTGHHFVVWARSRDAAPRHPHLGAWARCSRCGHERDWLAEGVRADTRLLDLVHGVVRPLHEIQAIARGEGAPERSVSSAPGPDVPAARASLRAIRRRSGEGRGSSRRSLRPRASRDHEPPRDR